jgi:hypothetical protein
VRNRTVPEHAELHAGWWIAGAALCMISSARLGAYCAFSLGDRTPETARKTPARMPWSS